MGRPALVWPAELVAPLKQANVYLQNNQETLAIPLLQKVRLHVAETYLQQEITHRLLRALIKLGRLAEARSDMSDAQGAWNGALPNWFEPMAWRINPHWWCPQQGGGVQLRRADGADAHWLKQAFAEGEFGAAVNREYSSRISAMPAKLVAAQLTQQHALPPADIGALLMLVEKGHPTEGWSPVGVASLVNIDESNRRAELIIGFPGARPHGLAVLQTGVLLADLAFAKLNFHKITVSIYADNPRLPELTAMLSKVGFVHEGIQREQVRLPSGAYVDVHLWGGLCTAVLQSRLLQQFIQRRLAERNQAFQLADQSPMCS